MPYTIRTKDGIVINNIPDDVKPDDPRLKARVAEIRAQKQGQPEQSGQASQAQPTQPEQQTPEGWERTQYGFLVRPAVTPGGVATVQREDGSLWFGPEHGNTGKAGWFTAEGRRAAPSLDTTATGVTGAIVRGIGPYGAAGAAGAAAGAPAGGIGAVPGFLAGTAAMGLTKLVGDPLAGIANAIVQGKDYGNVPPVITPPSETIERGFDWLGMPMAATPTERLVQTGSEALAGTGATIGLGQQLALRGGTVGRVGEVLASQPGQQLGGALGGALGAQGAAESGFGPGAQLGAGFLGGIAGARAATPRQIITPSGIPLSVQEAEKLGINVMTSDVAPPRTFTGKMAQSVGEKIPFVGTGGPRRAQQAQRIQAVKDVLTEYGAGAVSEAVDVASATDRVMADLLAKRNKDVTKYVKMKREVFDGLANAGEVPVPKATAAIDDQIQRLQRMGTQESQAVIGRLEDWKQAIQGKSIDIIEDIRKQVGEGFKGADQASIRSMGEKALDSVYGPLREDMGDFIKTKSGSKDYTKWRVANARLAESSKETTTTALKRVLQAGNTEPEAVQKLLFSQKPSDVSLVMKNLTAEGKANARMAIMAKAAADAGGIENLSPEKFLTAAKRLGAPLGMAFEGQDAQRVKGLIRALNLTQHACKAALVPPTGVQAVPFLAADVLSTTLGGPQGATAIAGGLGAAARLYESKPVREILMRLPRVAAGSAEENALIKRFVALTATKPKEEENRR